VDDNQTNRMVLIKNVQALGTRVDAAPSGPKGIEFLRRASRAGDPYHIVLLDMQMPGMDGEQAARAIKSDPSLREVKIIILTSMGQRGDAVRLEALGCSGYLLKPVKQQMLFDAILAILGRREDDVEGLITRHKLSEKRKAGARILLAEDNPVNQKLAVITLQKADYQVDAVETGLQALEKVKTNRYGLVLMDVQMPEMDGFEATRRIREWELKNNQHIPIIAMTAHAMAGDRERCIDSGMDDYVSKPLEPSVLFSAIDRWLVRGDTEKEANSSISEDNPTIQGAEKIEARSTFVVDPSIETVPADLEAALYRFNGDREFMKEMCRDFREHLPLRLEELKLELRDGNVNALSRTAHNLKGMSMNFNADVLSQLALELETCGRQDDLTAAPALVARIENEINRLREYLAQLLD
jgi:CheY-like chemotaxis protein/HPt (histidine-containing phosphotransfer) domain-containing protein